MRVIRVGAAEAATPVFADVAGIPSPGPGEVLIRVRAAGFIATELAWYPTRHDQSGATRTGAIPSHEFSGVVAAAGAGVEDFEHGLEVYGMNDWYSDGAMAEYCIAPAGSLAAKPRNLSHPEAATVPISALTAWQGLFEHAKLRAGERVLIHGGAGAVGTFAIQIARMHGAHVLTTVSTANLEFAKSLGAAEVIDYRKTRFEDSAGQVDVVFDTAGGETLDRSWGILKPNGRMVTIAATEEISRDERIAKAFFIVEPNQSQLNRITQLLEGGQIRPVLDSVIPFARAVDAYRGVVDRSGRGKLVIEMSEDV